MRILSVGIVRARDDSCNNAVGILDVFAELRIVAGASDEDLANHDAYPSCANRKPSFCFKAFP